MNPPPHVAVVGAGPAGLMAAEILATAGAAVTVYDRMPSAGRKFLLAGRGGLNLTHSEDFERFLTRYGAAAPHLRAVLQRFGPTWLRAWSQDLGQPTFVGSSGRVFPAGFKASPLLRAWLRRLGAMGVVLAPRHEWRGWDDAGALLFETPQGPLRLTPAATVLALGGASWPNLGSDGGWVAPLAAAGIAVAPLRAANCGFLCPWSDMFRDRFEGQVLRGVALVFEGTSARGEVTITRTGLEGGAVYALAAPLREAIAERGAALAHLALRPDVDLQALAARLTSRPPKKSLSTFLRSALKLPPAAIGLLHEAGGMTLQMPPDALARLLNAVPIELTGTAPIARAISSAGGVPFDEVDTTFMLRRRPGVFVAGEMLDWEAPTGGYLLQAAFATGASAGAGVLAWLGGGGS